MFKRILLFFISIPLLGAPTLRAMDASSLESILANSDIHTEFSELGESIEGLSPWQLGIGITDIVKRYEPKVDCSITACLETDCTLAPRDVFAESARDTFNNQFIKAIEHFIPKNTLRFTSLGAGKLAPDILLLARLIKRGYTNILYEPIDTTYRKKYYDKLKNFGIKVKETKITHINNRLIAKAFLENVGPDVLIQISPYVSLLKWNEQSISQNSVFACIDPTTGILGCMDMYTIQGLVGYLAVNSDTNKEKLPEAHITRDEQGIFDIIYGGESILAEIQE